LFGMRARFFVLGFAVLACSGALGPPLEAFRDGRLPEATAEFRRLEPAFPALSRGEQAHYALYRGLAHLGLGDAREADRWLTVAKRLERDHPDCFDASERGELYAAWRSLGRMPGQD
jgi:hypothetical protein